MQLIPRLSLLFIISIGVAWGKNIPIYYGNVLIPPSFAQALQEGLSVPIVLRYQKLGDRDSSDSDEPIGYATILLKGNDIYLIKVDFSADKNQGILNDEIIDKLSKENNLQFDESGKITVTSDANITLDLLTMHIAIEVSRNAFGNAKPVNVTKSLTPEIDVFTGIHNYNFGYSFSNNDSNYLDSNYLQISSAISHGADHLLLDGSLYNLGKNGQDGQIYRSMYERDINNRRVAIGMVSAWDLQSLGVISALNAGRIYGVSYGNEASSQIQEAKVSTTPVQVFMPADGEVRVYREGRMLALVNLPIGNHSIDTSAYPYGVYDVVVEVYTNGRLIDRSTQRVTKLNTNSNFVDSWGWQLWGGWMKVSTEELSDSPLVGVSGAHAYGSFSFSGSNYIFNEAIVSESAIQWQPSNGLNLSSQVMLSSDKSYRIANIANIQFTENASTWISQEKLVSGKSLSLSNNDQISLGFNVYLGGWIDTLGQISLNITHDRDKNTNRGFVDYSQPLFSGPYGYISMRASLEYENVSDDRSTNKSLMFNYTMPLDNNFSFGVSTNEKGDSIANLGYQTYLDGFINQVGINAQRTLNDKQDTTPAFSGLLGFNHNLASGNLSISRTSYGDLSGNLVTQGAVGTTSDNIVMTNKTQNSAGLIINTGLDDTSQLLAKINGQEYPVQGEMLFVTLPPYREYDIELLNGKKSQDSYEINMNKQRYTLFPGNIATLDAGSMIREMVTVFGVIRAEDGSVLANARLDNHIGTTVTNDAGEFSLDVEKAHPMLVFKQGNEYCEAKLDIRHEKGAAWVGDVVCKGLNSYAMN